MNNELDNLIQDNPVPLLRHFALTNKQALKKQILHTEEGKSTFFLSLFLKHKPSTQKDILELCLEYGYSLNTRTQIEKNSYSAFYNKLIPDYLHLWNHQVEDNLLSEITQLYGKDNILKLEEEFPILKQAYIGQKFKTIRVLESFGVGEHQELYKPNEILEIAQRDAQTLSFYWENKKNPEGHFNSVKEYFIKALDKFSTSNGDTDSYHLEATNKYIEKEIKSLSLEQTEELIALSATCINLKPYNHLIKSLGKTIRGYQSKTTPVWKYLDKAKNYQFLHKLLDAKTPFESQTSDGISYLGSMAKFLAHHHYTGEIKKSYESDYKKSNSIYKKMESVIDQDFWLTLNPQDNNHPWFHTACNNKNLFSAFSKNWLNIAPEKLNYYNKSKKKYELASYNPLEKLDDLYWGQSDKKEVIKDLLAKTWLYKDETNKSCIEQALDIDGNLFYNEKVCTQFISFMKHASDRFPFEAKEKILYCLLDRRYGNNKELTMLVLDSLQGSKQMNWNKLLQEEFFTYSQNESFLPLIKNIQLQHTLEQKLPGKKHKI